MMMCAEPEGVMEQESLYLAALETANVYSIDGDRLQLRTSEGSLVADYRAAGDSAAVEVGAEAGTAQPIAQPAVAATPASTDELAQSLANMEYKSEYTANGTAPLEDGKYSEEAAPGSASKIEVSLTDHVAVGELNGQAAAAVGSGDQPRWQWHILRSGCGDGEGRQAGQRGDHQFGRPCSDQFACHRG